MALKVSQFPAPPLLSPIFENGKVVGLDKKPTAPVISFPWVEYFRAITNELGGKVPITGSRSGGTALTNLLTVLSNLGLIDDQTTP